MAGDYKHTLNLPKTSFPMKGNLPVREPERVQWWDELGLYEKMQARRADAPTFLLHDGPPYANNNIHQGHIMNKVLKDVLVKYKSMAGMRAPYVPGWDCHGLPIELQVDKQLGKKKSELSTAEFRRACREYAAKWVGVQSEEFQRLGVQGRWDDPYLTMAYKYEAQTVRELARFAESGALYKGKKPVYWCIQDATALAEAEVEYDTHRSPSIYVAFELGEARGALPEVEGAPALVIWTTTPWTLPANRATAVHPEYDYLLYRHEGRALIIAEALLPAFLADCDPAALAEGRDPEAPAAAQLRDPAAILARFKGEALEGASYAHPLTGEACPVIFGDHVTLEAGTGLVHTAPGHGADDYTVGLAHGLEVFNPVDDYGRYYQTLPESMAWLRGLRIWAANPQITAHLAEKGALLSPPDLGLEHSYPHCWRCSKPVIFRATHQWFISMEATGLREKALAEVDKVRWVPETSRERIRTMIAGRPDWCISRQRSWGVPIPALSCDDCGEATASAEYMNKVAEAFEAGGADVWYERSVEELIPGATCQACGSGALSKETDILDVWFDSGVSFAAVCENDDTLGLPADVYFEGSDQHRGWFQSSLMCAVGTRGESPYREVLTHGFLVDGKGKKLSKKLGNFTLPEKVIKAKGAELLRLTLASEDFRSDPRYSDQILDRFAEGYRKIRNTLRFALGSLEGFNPATDLVPQADWSPLDRWAYGRLQAYLAQVAEAYERYELHKVYRATIELCAIDLSAVYFDVQKDLLYCAHPSWPARRAAQTVLWHVAQGLCQALAPVLSFTSEEAWQSLREAHPEAGLAESVLLSDFPAADLSFELPDFEALLEVREAALGELEKLRRDKVIGRSLDARITLTAPPALYEALAPHAAFLRKWFIVSAVELQAGEALQVEVETAAGQKCERCWEVSEVLGAHPEHPELCPRCVQAVTGGAPVE